MSKNITQRYLSEAGDEIRATSTARKKESRRIRFVLITTSIFLILFVPPLVWGVYRMSNATYYQAIEHADGVAYANLLGRGRRGKAIGAEQQRPLDVMTARQYLQEKHRSELSAQYEQRVNEVLAVHNANIRKQRLTLTGTENIKQSLYRGFVGHPTELVVKSLELRVTKNNHLLADLLIHGEPLGADYHALFFVTDPQKLAWLFSWDNRLRSKKQRTLRSNLRSDLVSLMQSRPGPTPELPTRPCIATNKSKNFSEFGAKRNLAERLDDLKRLDYLNFDLESVYVEIDRLTNQEFCKARVFCIIGHPSIGVSKFKANLCMTAFEQNTWKIVWTNSNEISNSDNKSQISKCEQSLKRMNNLLN